MASLSLLGLQGLPSLPSAAAFSRGLRPPEQPLMRQAEPVRQSLVLRTVTLDQPLMLQAGVVKP